MRNPENVLKSLTTCAEQADYQFKRLYRNLYNPEFYQLAYQRIYAKPGNMTQGTDGLTIDGMGMERINKIILSMKDHSYQPKPARREYIKKQNNPKKKRPLGIPSVDDKLVQEVIRNILESIYEPAFSPNSHGFRPRKSCHTALQQIKSTYTGTKWFVEGDIKGCFDNIDHHVLVDILRRKIKDEYFIALIWKFLKAGYLENWQYHSTYSGTPQGSLISPVLANIYLNEFDNFMSKYEKEFYKGKKRKQTKAYIKAANDYQIAKRKLKKQWDNLTDAEKKQENRQIKDLKNIMLNTVYNEPMDNGYKRLKYVRYADDFIIGVIGGKEDAERVKHDIGEFLLNELKLTMSEEKTLITHGAAHARFLSYDIEICNNQSVSTDENGNKARRHSGKARLLMPREKWLNKLREYKAFTVTHDKTKGNAEIWKPAHRANMLNNDDLEIMLQYNAEIRGLYNYYCLAENVSSLHSFGYIMKYSMYRTYAMKYKTTIGGVMNRFYRNGRFGIPYQTKTGDKTMYAYDEGFKKLDTPLHDIDSVSMNNRFNLSSNSLITRLKAKRCEWCGEENCDIEIHHVRKLKDLKGKALWERKMIARKRKTMALCKQCHVNLHSGKLD